MKPEHNLSDELLAKYLAGKTSPEETEQVLSFLAENDGNLDDFAQICAAIEVQKSAEMADSAQKKAVRRRILWLASSAAAIALLVVVALFAFQPKENSHWVAQQTDSTQNTNVVPKLESTDNQEGDIENKKTENTDAVAPNWRGEQPKNYAESTSKTGFCTMITPSQSKYAVSTQRTYFDFSWSTDAVSETLILKDETGQTLYRKEMQNEDYVKLKVADYQKHGKLSWTLVLTYSSGATETKTGDIVFEN